MLVLCRSSGGCLTNHLKNSSASRSSSSIPTQVATSSANSANSNTPSSHVDSGMNFSASLVRRRRFTSRSLLVSPRLVSSIWQKFSSISLERSLSFLSTRLSTPSSPPPSSEEALTSSPLIILISTLCSSSIFSILLFIASMVVAASAVFFVASMLRSELATIVSISWLMRLSQLAASSLRSASIIGLATWVAACCTAASIVGSIGMCCCYKVGCKGKGAAPLPYR